VSGPSTYLSWDEVGCADGTPYPDGWRSTRGVALGEMFEAFRKECGDRPLKILSGYRTPSHNYAVGGAPESQHVQGTALDIVRPDDLSFGELVAAAFRVVELGLLRGVGLYKHSTSIHLDIRPGKLAVWVK